MKIKCPSCEGVLEVSEDHVGAKIMCEACSCKFILPDTLEELKALEVRKPAPTPPSRKAVRRRKPKRVPTANRKKEKPFSWQTHIIMSFVIGMAVAAAVLAITYSMALMNARQS